MTSPYPKIKELLKNYIESLTVHGVTKIFTGNIIERVFWFLVFISFFSYFLITLHSLFVQYNNHTYITNTQLFELEQIKLPIITVCNANSFLCGSLLYKNESTSKFLWCDHNELKKKVTVFTNNIKCWKNNKFEQNNCNYELSLHHPGCIIINPLQNITQDSPGRNRNLVYRFKL